VDRKHLDELIEIERSYWWHIAKRMIVTEILKRYFPPPARLIEGGFGAGWNLLAFKELGYQITGFDIMPESVETGKNHGLSNVAVHDLQNPWPVEKGSTRVVVMLDVLEHTSDPSRVLKNAALAIFDIQLGFSEDKQMIPDCGFYGFPTGMPLVCRQLSLFAA
jgi:2-polyprenyl-3-methyl-5-hydroxy-6-metoxy-1,4-benzoquinol methylase